MHRYLSRFRVLPVSLAAWVTACFLPAVHAQTNAFKDTFTGASTVNSAATAPTSTAAAYQQLAGKTFNPNPPVITSGNLRFGIVSTSSGFNHTQALFTNYPVTLVNTGDYIELTVNFSTESGVITAQTNSTLFFGLFNAGQVQPIPGGMNGTVAVATAGYAQTWQGYVSRIFYAGGSNGFYGRPAQTAIAANNQDVLYNFPGATGVGSTATSTLAAFTAASPYTEVYRITKASATTLTLSSSLYAGTEPVGTPLYTQSATSASALTNVFDAFAFGWRATGSVASVMNVSAVKITTTGTTTIIPEILTQPLSQTKMIGEGVSLAVVADGGSGTALSYQWKKNGADLPGATGATHDIASAVLEDAGDYTVVVTDVAGSTTSAVATLTVSAGAVPPSIVIDPVGNTIPVGGSHSFGLTVNGTAPLSYQWQKSTDGGTNYGDVGGATAAAYEITGATLADAGLYRVVVTNAQGSATSAAAALAVTQTPAITVQPVGAVLNPGAALALSVTATGSPAPTYQWRKNGVAIAGATASTYAVASVSGADTGGYTVVVSNSVGSVTSAVASVAVLSATMAQTAVTPVPAATGLNPDTRLTITFNETVTPGTSGYLRIYDAADDSIVDTIDLAAATAQRDTLRAASTLSTQLLPVQSKPIGGIANNFNYYPITVAGSTATIYPRNGVLAYNKTYYVKIEPGAFVNASGESFAGISDATTWRFSTKAAGPAAGAANLTVAADGSGDFTTLQAALDFVPAGNIAPVTIRVKNGTYFEEVGFQSKHFVTILGEHPDLTIITYPNNNTFNNVSGVYHRATLVAQNVHDFTLAGLTIHNTTPQNGSQAEAIVLNGSSATAGRNLVTNCRFYSYQDTVQFNKQTYVSDSIIHGDVDFMWGDGPTFFENCDIRILRTGGYFTQIRNDSSRHGFVFRNCRFTAPAGIAGTFFGRIDPAGFPYSEVVVLDSTVGDAVNNALLATATGVSGSNYLGGWWLLNNAASAAGASNVHNWTNALLDGTGAALVSPNADTFTTMPVDAALQTNYRDAVWVLNTSLAGIVNGSWTPSLAPVFASSPASQNVGLGDLVTLTANVVAVPAATYQWKKDGDDIPGATSGTHVIPSASAADAGVYTVVATNSAGSAASIPATVTVGDTALPPVITEQPASQNVLVGAGASFSVTATGSAPLTYQWQKDGIDIIGAISASYTIASTTLVDAGNYTVVVSNAGGIETSDPAVLTVTAPVGGAVVDDAFGDGNSSNEDFATGSLRLFNGRTANTRVDSIGSVAFTIASTSSDGFWAHFTESGSPVSLAVGETLKVEVTFSTTGFVGTGQDIRFGVFNSAGTRNTVNLTGGMNSSLFADDLAYGVRYVASTSSTPFTLLKRNAVGATTNPNNPFNSTNATDWAPVTAAASGTSTIASLTSGTPYVLAYTIHRESETNTVVTSAVTGGSLPEGYSQTATDTATTLTSFDYFAFRIANNTFATGVTFTRLKASVERVAPAITTQPIFSDGTDATTLAVGGSTVLSVGASGSGLSYQWYKGGSVLAGANAATLAFSNVQLTDAGSYTVVVSNLAGFVTSDPATLTITGGATAPSIVGQPVDLAVAEGSGGSFTVTVTGTAPFSYQWYKNGSPLVGATAATYAIVSSTPGDAGSYHVVVTNAVDSVTSDSAILTVEGIADIALNGYAASVTGGAAGPTVTVANAADLKLQAESATPGTIIVSGVIDLGLNGRIKLQSNKTLRGATTSSTILGSVNISNANNVIVSNLNISANTGDPATNDGVTIANSTNVLVTKCTIYDSTDGNLDVINGSDLVTISWCKFYYTRNNGHNFSNLVGSSDTDVGSGNGLTNYRITWHHNWWADGVKQRNIACRFGSSHMFNNYWSNAGNDYCTESRNIASIFSEHNFYNGVKDPLAKRDALVTDVGLLMTIGNVFNNCTGTQLVSGDLVFTPPYSYGLDDPAVVPALVMAGAGNVTVDAPIVPTATINGSTPVALVGGTVTLTVVPAGFAPVSYQWRRNNFVIPGATAATLDLASVQLADAGAYTVVLGLPGGDAVVSAPFQLSVELPPEPPAIAVPPTGQAAVVGDNVSFTVVATGTAPLSYQWSKDGSPLAGATSDTLALVSVSLTDAGSYAVTITNAVGFATSDAALLSVSEPVAIITPPQAQSATVGDMVTFAVTATGYPAPTFQWQRNGLPIDGATSASFVFGPVTTAAAGDYSVVVTNPLGSVTSNAVALTVAKALASVTLGDLAHVYDGSAKAATASSNPSGLAILFTYDGSPSAPTNAGSYAVVATVSDVDYYGGAAGTLIIEPAPATLALGDLEQPYDGTARTVGVTSDPAGLAIIVTYDGSTTPPTYPGSYEVVATTDEDNYLGIASGTLKIRSTVLVRHAPIIVSTVEGSVQMVAAENISLANKATVTGDLLVPGTPSVQLNGNALLAGTLDGPGDAAPANFSVTLSGQSLMRYLVRRIDPVALPAVSASPMPEGTRNVSLTKANQSAGDFATLRNLTLSGNAGLVAVPPGTYGNFSATGNSGFILGVAGATEPAVYNLQNLAINVLPGNAKLLIAGPVIVTLANGTIINGAAGSATNPEWLTLRIASGGLTVSGSNVFSGNVTAPTGIVTLNNGAVLNGSVISDRLTLNGTSVLNDPEL
jgi:pectate lyase/pectin methylesterase-like acyl-CoA thioesterase